MRSRVLGLACAAFFVLAITSASTQEKPTGTAGFSTEAAAAAANASPELVGSLAKELGSTKEQAAGAAGALFGLAQSRLKPEEFTQVSKAVPGMSSLLKAAPKVDGGGGIGGALSKATGSAAGLATAASAFSKMGLKPELVSKAVPILTSFVSKSGGADVAKLLSGALK